MVVLFRGVLHICVIIVAPVKGLSLLVKRIPIIEKQKAKQNIYSFDVSLKSWREWLWKWSDPMESSITYLYHSIKGRWNMSFSKSIYQWVEFYYESNKSWFDGMCKYFQCIVILKMK